MLVPSPPITEGHSGDILPPLRSPFIETQKLEVPDAASPEPRADESQRGCGGRGEGVLGERDERGTRGCDAGVCNLGLYDGAGFTGRSRPVYLFDTRH